MKYKEIVTYTRPDVSISFYTEDSTHVPESESDWTTTLVYKHYIQTYVNTGKCGLTAPSLSEDGLVLTYTTTYASADVINEMYNDPFFYGDNPVKDSRDKRSEYAIKNKIIATSEMFPL